MNPSQIVEFVLVLLIAASIIAFIADRFRIPYTVALVVGGFGIDFFHVPIQQLIGGSQAGDVHFLSPEIVLTLFLPALLFEAGINLNLRSLRSSLTPVLLLAVGGVMIALLITGYGVHWLIGIPLLPAMIFGALISATDPVAVLAIFRSLGVARRLSVLIEGESLLNDGTAIVLFQIVVAAAVGTGGFALTDLVRQFLVVSFGGAVLGLVFGYAASRITEQIDDARIEITLSMIIAYATYLIAEHLHVSGVIATVMAGLMVGSYGARIGMSARTRLALWAYWEYVSFVINSLLFLLIGVEVHVSRLIAAGGSVLIATAVVLIARAAAVYGVVPVSNLFARKIPLSWRHVAVWGGLHGGVSIALALSLQPNVPARDLILTLTFGVVAFSIVVQGSTMKPALRVFGIETQAESEHDRIRVRAMAIKAAQRELDRLVSGALISPSAQQRMRTELQDRLEALRRQIEEIEAKDPESLEKDLHLARSRLMQAEKSAIRRAAIEGFVSSETEERLITEADEQLDQLLRRD